MIDATELARATVFVSSLLVACGTTEAPVAVPQVAAANDVETDAPAEAAPQARAGAPKIAAEAPLHDFGAIKATDSLEHVFKIKNVGTADLKIERVQRT